MKSQLLSGVSLMQVIILLIVMGILFSRVYPSIAENSKKSGTNMYQGLASGGQLPKGLRNNMRPTIQNQNIIPSSNAR